VPSGHESAAPTRDLRRPTEEELSDTNAIGGTDLALWVGASAVGGGVVGAAAGPAS
jgi:hypothetical protein